MASKYERIAETLRGRIHDGVYGDGVPSERALAEEFATTPMTVRRALDELVREHLIVREVGRGTRVREEARQAVTLKLVPSLIAAPLHALLSRHFPSVPIELLPLGEGMLDPAGDVTLMCTTFLGSYERHFRPLPNIVVERLLADPDLSREAFNLHRRNGLHYGIPLLHSPGALLVNTRLLDELGERLPPELTVAAVKQLKRALAAHPRRPRLFDWRFPNVVLFQLFLARVPDPDLELSAAEWRDVGAEVVADYLELVSGGPPRPGDVAAGDALFGVTCRQTFVEALLAGDLPPEWDLVPLFHQGTPVNPVFSGSLLISRRTENPKRAYELAEFCVETPVQQLIGQGRHGIPVRKSAAFDSFQGDIPVAELLFMRELRHSADRLHPHVAALRGAIWAATSAYTVGDLGAEGVRSLVLGTLDHQLREQAIHRRFQERPIHEVLDASMV